MTLDLEPDKGGKDGRHGDEATANTLLGSGADNDNIGASGLARRRGSTVANGSGTAVGGILGAVGGACGQTVGLGATTRVQISLGTTEGRELGTRATEEGDLWLGATKRELWLGATERQLRLGSTERQLRLGGTER